MSIKNYIYTILYYSGINYFYSLWLDRKIFIVMYHSIHSKDTQDELRHDLYRHISISVDDFHSQVLYMKRRGHTFLSFDDLQIVDLAKIKKPTIIYFDDGFKDVLINALPLLKKYDIPATIFLPTGVIDRKYLLWTVMYREILAKKGFSIIEQNKIIHDIKTKPDSYRKMIMNQYNLVDYKYLFEIFLSWEEIRLMSKGGIEFGSHSVTHSRLSESNTDLLIKEVILSKERIEEEINKKVSSFSFPYGRYNTIDIEFFKKAGYKFLVSKGKGLNSGKDLLNNISFLKNISPKPNDSLNNFKLKLYSLNIKS